MQFMLFICTDPEATEAETRTPGGDGGWTIEQWGQEVSDRGLWLSGNRLRPPEDATTVRVRDGELLVTDGPFTESKEWIAGFDVLECADLDAAIEIAAKHPMAYTGRLELRPIWPMDEN